MRKIESLNKAWEFIITGKEKTTVDLPHTWNGDDGQDGGDNYLRAPGEYTKTLGKIELKDGERAYLEFKGVNSQSDVYLNDKHLKHHDGGYSTFIIDITDSLNDTNFLKVIADNSYTNKVYPQKADFTFYGGIYRDVNLLILPKDHFEFLKDSAPPLKLFPSVKGNDGIVKVEANPTSGQATILILDKEGKEVASGESNEDITVKNVHLWNGVKDPYLYTVKAVLINEGKVVDEVSSTLGFRTFKIDPKEGFFLNGKAYPLRGVCRHQDRPHIGNALTKKEHDEDMALIREVGANTIRLAHYQHDQYFYDLCDKYGMVVWAEIPYISKYMHEADQNAFDQMAELIHQNFNHPSIVTWGLSNEITMFRANKKCRDHHKKLNAYVHKEDPSRVTTMAHFSVMSIFNRVGHITDISSYNLYYGWYAPITKMTGWVLDTWRICFPKTPIGLSEYGAEAITHFHSSHPYRGDNTEEYQVLYHERMIKVINKRKYLWATHVWNMFDFAADARNQGNEPGMNHKGLVTFDRKIKKDAFYAYKVYWSDEPFVHICGSRYVNRKENKTTIKVYSNQKEVSLLLNGKEIAKKSADKIFKFKVKLTDVNEIEARSGELSDKIVVNKVNKKDPSYKMKRGGTNKSWEK